MLTPTALYFEPDHVLAEMVEGLGLTVTETDHPFEPESGAYAQHSHDHRLSPIKFYTMSTHNAAQLAATADIVFYGITSWSILLFARCGNRH